MHAVHNARIQLTATLINNLAAAFVVAGFIAPTVISQFHIGALAGISIGVALHLIARSTLGEIR
jgi:hypothetical protein